jgi:hypothetical protein
VTIGIKVPMSFARGSAAARGGAPPSRGRKRISGSTPADVAAPATPSVNAASTSLSRVYKSPRLAAKEAALQQKTSLLPLSQRLNGGKRLAPLPPFRPPALPPSSMALPSNSKKKATSMMTINESDDNESESDEDNESQPLLSQHPPVDVVQNSQSTARVAESQLTTSTGLETVSSRDDEDNNGDVSDDEANGVALLSNFFDSNEGDTVEDNQDLSLVCEYVDQDFSSQNGMHGFSNGNEFDVNERCRYYMNGAPISPQTRQAVEFVYMIEALSLVTGEDTTDRATLHTKVFNRYKQLVRNIPATRFSQFDLQNQMCTRIYNSKAENGSAPSFFRTTKKVKESVQTMIRKIPTLPKLPSGRDIFDVRNDFILSEYKAAMGKVR